MNKQEKFIEKSRKIHGNKYDYSKVDYIDCHTKVCIVCPEHGEFWQTPNAHLKGRGCLKCGQNNKRKTIAQFITEAHKIYGEKYDYSKVEYKNAQTKICIICPEHGEFWQKPYVHLQGHSCPKCNHQSYSYTTQEFIEKARQVHGDKYDYSKVEYVNNATKVCIICPIHGEFWMRPQNHITQKQGCPKCSHQSYAYTTEEFIKNAQQIHGNKYDYSKVNYVNNQTKVCIICPIHGECWITPINHLNGCGCSECAAKFAIAETQLFESLTKEFPQCQFVHSFRNAEILDKQEIDIYSLVFKIAIEYQGKQHFEAIDFFGGENGFEMQLVRDNLKIEKCNKANIKLFHFTYDKNYCRDNINYEVITDEETLFQKIRESLSERDSPSSN